MDPDPDPSIFIIDLQDANKKQICKKKLYCILLFEGSFTSFFKGKKVKKKAQNSGNQGFSYYFCLMIEGSGSGSATLPTIHKFGMSIWGTFGVRCGDMLLLL